ncbi:hypothetical protein TL16_g00424 [Triparma laevis f. inornata]|uniref:Uncharacterized protein n=1 Tax=Triparma laevis f. inornata TaxID=1714386 RepID=A0A9W6ZEN9_9STRA|nr:hypothetical protein TL16_g00424 [Triparma laevis f. inornata]
MDPAQPFYYHICDPMQNLSLKVTLRRIHGGLNESQKQTGKNQKQSKLDSNKENPSPSVVEKSVEWQEKVFGPREIAVLAPSSSERADLRSPRTPRSKASSASSLSDTDYKESLYQRLRDGFDPLDEIQEAMVFTYVDKDGFVPKSTLHPRLTTSVTQDDPTFNPLGLATATMPMRQLPKGVLPDSTNTMKSHLGREAPFKIMYVMAAVDCDVESIKEGSLEKNNDSIYGGPAAIGGPRFFEKVLCTIKLFSNNTMEATPGFSEEEPEDEYNPTFASSHSLQVRQTEGPKTTTFRFVTPRGSVYEYAIENRNAVESVVSTERLLIEETYRDQRKVQERRNRRGNFFFGKPESPDVPFFLHSNIEIVSAEGFGDEGGYLFTEYELSMPNGWCFATQVPGTNWGGRTPPDERVLTGATHLARPTYLKPKSSLEAGKAFGTTNIPRGEDTMGGLRSQFFGLTLFFTISAGMLLGEAYMIWLFGALLMIGAVMGFSPTGQYDHQLSDPVYHFGYPTNIHLAAPPDIHTNPAVMNSAPTLLFQVSSKHAFQRHIIEGYGYVKIPTTPGTYELNVKMWVPRGGIRSEMRNFFVGGAYRLHDLRSIEMPSDMGGATFLSKFGFRTEKSGSLKVRINAVTHRKPMETADDGSDMGNSQTLNQGRSTVDDILSRVRTNRNMAASRGGRNQAQTPVSPLRRRSQMMDKFTFSETDTGTQGSAASEKDKDDSVAFPYKTAPSGGSTADVLAKVRARRAARNGRGDNADTM